MRRKKSLLTVRGFKKFLATFLATHNLRTAYLLNCQRQKLATLKVPGTEADLRIRTGTSDALFLREAVLHGFEFREYHVPLEFHPRCILDIGANTGIVSVALKRKYPRARLFAFEPLPENYTLLKHNLRHLDNVMALPFGLGRETTTMEYYASDDAKNLGGGTFYPIASQIHKRVGKLQIMSPAEALSKFEIQHVELIKIDTEGAEYDILTSFPPDILSEVTAVVGELHSVRDEELLAYLSQWFDLEHTPTKGRMSLFKAINKNRLSSSAPHRRQESFTTANT